MLKILVLLSFTFALSESSAKKPDAPVYRADLDLTCKELKARNAQEKSIMEERQRIFDSMNIPAEKQKDSLLPKSFKEKLDSYWDKKREIESYYNISGKKLFEITGRAPRELFDTLQFCGFPMYENHKISDLLLEQQDVKLMSINRINKMAVEKYKAKLEACEHQLAGDTTWDGKRKDIIYKDDKGPSDSETETETTKED